MLSRLLLTGITLSASEIGNFLDNSYHSLFNLVRSFMSCYLRICYLIFFLKNLKVFSSAIVTTCSSAPYWSFSESVIVLRYSILSWNMMLRYDSVLNSDLHILYWVKINFLIQNFKAYDKWFQYTIFTYFFLGKYWSLLNSKEWKNYSSPKFHEIIIFFSKRWKKYTKDLFIWNFHIHFAVMWKNVGIKIVDLFVTYNFAS